MEILKIKELPTESESDSLLYASDEPNPETFYTWCVYQINKNLLETSALWLKHNRLEISLEPSFGLNYDWINEVGIKLCDDLWDKGYFALYIHYIDQHAKNNAFVIYITIDDQQKKKDVYVWEEAYTYKSPSNWMDDEYDGKISITKEKEHIYKYLRDTDINYVKKSREIHVICDYSKRDFIFDEETLTYKVRRRKLVEQLEEKRTSPTNSFWDFLK